MRLVSKDFFRYYSAIIAVFILSWVISACQTLGQSSQQSRFIENPAAIGAQFPYLSSLPDRSMLMSWVEGTGSHHALKFAIYHQERWVRSGEAMRGSAWYVNWADYPAVVAIDDSFWVAHWRVKSKTEQIYDYDVFFSISVDAGVTWSAPQKPYQDDTASFQFTHGSAFKSLRYSLYAC